MRVLIVDDDEFTRTLLVGAVASLGHDCASAVDGFHAWSYLQINTADVVIGDWQMPGLDGLGLCARIRSVDGPRRTYFLLMTAEGHRHTAISALDGGVDDYLVKPVDLEELQGRLAIAERSVDLYRELSARRDELELVNLALEQSAERDPLTRAYNRLRLADDMAAIDNRALRYGHGYAVLLFDIDHFGAYNETYGRTAGDQTLIQVASMIGDHRRTGDSVYRYGGQQFLLLLPEQTTTEALVAAERIRVLVAATPVQHAHLNVDGHVTVSVGIADVPGGRAVGDAPRAFQDAVRRAHDALQIAQRNGRNRSVLGLVWSPARRPQTARPEMER